MLQALVAKGTTGADAYYGYLEKLRASNIRYLAVGEEEILHHLRKTRVEDGRVVESRPLRILRRYIAACLIRSGALQRPPVEETPNRFLGETEFVAGLNHAVSDALLEVWKADEEEEVRRARAEWLMDKLYMDLPHLASLTTTPGSEQEEHQKMAYGLAGLVIQALQLDWRGDTGGSTPARQAYLGWIHTRVLHARFDADPRMAESVGEALKRYLTSLREDAQGAARGDLMGRLILLFLGHLPEPLREGLSKDADFMASFGVRSGPAAGVAGLSFDPAEFVTAAHAAIGGRETNITPLGHDEPVTFAPGGGGQANRALRFSHPNSGNDIVVRDDLLLLLSDSPAEREAVLRNNRDWFDCPKEEFEKAVAEIASIESHERRIDEAEKRRDASAVVFYAGLPEKVRGRFVFNELRPPDTQGLVRHLRLPLDTGPDEPSAETLEAAASRLIREEGLPATTERLVGLPVPLPHAVIDAVAALSEQERRLLFERVLSTPDSPLSRLHTVRLLTEFEVDPRSIRAWSGV